jgi:phosphatidylglycerophosphatase A
LKDRLAALAVSCLGLGFSPIAPGTFGTLGGLAIAWAIPERWDFRLAALGAAGLVFLVGWPLGNWAERHYGRKDPGVFVLDEVVGFLVSVIPFYPTGRPGLGALWFAFFAFRVFDVLKPRPADRLERLPGGLGIMLDDVMAGLYTNAILSLARLLWR